MKLALNSNMQKTLVNIFYWILVKSVESYYGDSLNEIEVQYKTSF